MRNIKAVLLAAGESSRFWPLNEAPSGKTRHKSTIKIAGKPIILWTILSLMKAGIKDFVVVQSPSGDVEKALESYDVDATIDFVVQEKPAGMGDAVEKARELVDDYFLVLNPNHADAHHFVKSMLDVWKRKKPDTVVVGRKTEAPWNYGVFVLGEDGKPVGLVEKPEKGKEPSNIRIMGIYLLSSKFFDYHKKVSKHHYSYEEALDAMLKKESAELMIMERETTTLKFPWHVLDFARSVLDEWFRDGWISDDASISERAVIEGNVMVESGAKIMENAVIKGPAYIGRNAVVGTNALVRDYTVLEEDVVVGANAEVTRSAFLDGVHVHSGFFGDTVLAEEVKVGAGTIFANVRLDRKNIMAEVKGKKIDTGRRKLGGIVGVNTKIGINCSIMPGKMVGSNVVVGPATLVDENVPSNVLYFTKGEKMVVKRER